MDRPFVGYDKEYAKKYEAVFSGGRKRRVLQWIQRLLIKLFVEG